MSLETVYVTGRTRIPLRRKLNPYWWLLNDTEQTVDEAPWYHPEWPRWRRWLVWNFLRNPAQNFSCFVVGVMDKNYTVTGREPAMRIQRNDEFWKDEATRYPPELGWQYALLHGGELWVPRPWINYCGRRNVWYAGWQPRGFARVKVNGPIASAVGLLLACLWGLGVSMLVWKLL